MLTATIITIIRHVVCTCMYIYKYVMNTFINFLQNSKYAFCSYSMSFLQTHGQDFLYYTPKHETLPYKKTCIPKNE